MALSRGVMGLLQLMIVVFPDHTHLLFLIGGCTGSSESTLVKMPHCWKSHVAAQMRMARYATITDHRTTHGTCTLRKSYQNTDKQKHTYEKQGYNY